MKTMGRELSQQENPIQSLNPRSEFFDVNIFEKHLKKNYCFCGDSELKCIEEELVDKNIITSKKHASIENRRYKHEKLGP